MYKKPRDDLRRPNIHPPSRTKHTHFWPHIRWLSWPSGASGVQKSGMRDLLRKLQKKGGWVTLCFEWGASQGSQWLYIVVVSFLCKKKLFPQLSSFFDHFPLIFHAIYDIVNPNLMEFLQKWPKSCNLRRKPRMATWGLPDTSPPYIKKNQWKLVKKSPKMWKKFFFM